MKVKLFRRGRLVGIVRPNFHNQKQDSVWQKLELPELYGEMSNRSRIS